MLGIQKIRPSTFIISLALLQGLALVTRWFCVYSPDFTFCVYPGT